MLKIEMTKRELEHLKQSCNYVQFKTIYWTQHAVGILTSRCTRDLVIDITYSDRSKKRLYRNPFYVKKDFVKTFPIERKTFGEVHVVPIDALTEIIVRKPRTN